MTPVRKVQIATGSLSPAHGTWGASVLVKGSGFGSAEGVRVIWYPADDDSKPPVMSQTATLYSRHGADEVEIRIPANPATTGWAGEFSTGVLRVYLKMPGTLVPVFAGRYSVELPSVNARTDQPIAPPGPDRRPQGEAPHAVKAGATGPTTVRVEWQAPVKTPQRYAVARKTGTAAAQNLPSVPANATSVLDNAVQPHTTYSYTVTAVYGAAAQSGVSDAVEVTTPVILPPAGFTVRSNGPNAIQLSWQPRAGAVAYQLTRNGTVFPASASNYDDLRLPAGDYTYTIRTIMRLPSGAEMVGEISNPVTMHLRPFNIIAAGDSVMWGQGLADSDKFSRKVQNWVQGLIRNKSVTLQVFAHSGAIIASPTTLEGPTVRPGEVPAKFPSIRRQLLDAAPAHIDPRQVDLILLDGCINDVGVTTILGDLMDLDQSGLRQKIENACYSNMWYLLRDAAVLYPNARIVVTGYFPIASDQSDILELTGLLWGVTSGGIAVGSAMMQGLIGGAPFAVGSAQVLALFAGIGTAAVKPALVARSRTFDEESETLLRRAISAQGPRNAQRMRFAQIPYQGANAYGASATWLWHIPIALQIDGNGVAMRKDEVFDPRAQDCQRTGEDLLCYIASISHPNVAGAQAYTNAIVDQLTPFVQGWASDHSGTIVEPQTPLYVHADFGPRTASGGSFAVRVASWSTGVPVAGHVALDGQVAGDIDKQVTYAFRSTNPTDVAVEVRPNGFAPQRFTIPVRTVGVHVSRTQSRRTRTLTVTAKDRETGQALSGTVRVVDGNGNSVSGQTGQPLRYTACSTTLRDVRPDGKPVQMHEDIDCKTTVTVPYYPATDFADADGNY